MDAVQDYERGSRPVSEGRVDGYGNPQDSNEAHLCGIMTTDDDKMEAKEMSGGRGDVVEFMLRTSRRTDVQFRVTCFGDLATQVGFKTKDGIEIKPAMVRKGMRISVSGRLRERTSGFSGRIQKQVDIVAWEVGIWDGEYKIHWLQYEVAKFNENFVVETLPGVQGGPAVG